MWIIGHRSHTWTQHLNLAHGPPKNRNTVAVALLDADPPVGEGEDAVLLLEGGEGEAQEGSAGAGAGARARGPTIPVGEALLGRVVDPLGRPVAGLDPLSVAAAAAGAGGGQKTSTAVPLDPRGVKGQAPLLHRASPGIVARKPLCARLTTGVKAVDVFHSLAHGQCFAVLGRRGSGKTALALQVSLWWVGLGGGCWIFCRLGSGKTALALQVRGWVGGWLVDFVFGELRRTESL